MISMIGLMQNGELDNLKLSLSPDENHLKALEDYEMSSIGLNKVLSDRSEWENYIEKQGAYYETIMEQIMAAALQKGYELAIGHSMTTEDFENFLNQVRVGAEL